MVKNKPEKSVFLLFFDAYLFVFYSTNFLLNLLNALTMLVPLLAAEHFRDVGSWRELAAQFCISILLTYQYSIIYVVNDIVDFRSDVDNKVAKPTLVARHKSRLVSLIFLIFVAFSLIAGSRSFLKLGQNDFNYFSYLVVLSLVHSYWLNAKPLTFFLERGSRFLAAPFFIFYVVKSSTLTLIFLLSSIVIYPIVMHREYIDYLEVKRKHNLHARRISAWIYTFYYLVFFSVLPFTVVSSGELQVMNVTPFIVVMDVFLGSLALIAFHSLFNLGIRKVVGLTHARWTLRYPFLTYDRRILLAKTAILVALTAFLVVFNYGK